MKHYKLIVTLATIFFIFVITDSIFLGSALFNALAKAKTDVVTELKLCATNEAEHHNQLEALKTEHQSEIVSLNNLHKQEMTKKIILCFMLMKNRKLTLPEAIKEMNIILDLCNKYQLDPWPVISWVKIESDFTLNPPVGDAGEMGPAQVTPEVFDDYELLLGLENHDFKKWDKTLRVGITHYRNLLEGTKSNIYAAVGQYNAGTKEGWEKRSAEHVKKFRSTYAEVLRLKYLLNN